MSYSRNVPLILYLMADSVHCHWDDECFREICTSYTFGYVQSKLAELDAAMEIDS